MSKALVYSSAKTNLEDYASGRVLYGSPGATNFPVRLAEEMFVRCSAYLLKQGQVGPYVVCDPLCGIGYLLTVVALRNPTQVKAIVASDADNNVLQIAKKNLRLLTKVGIQRRIDELKQAIQTYDKPSHKDALLSALRIQLLVDGMYPELAVHYLQHDAVSAAYPAHELPKIDIVLCDLPYGNLTQWTHEDSGANVTRLLGNLRVSLNLKAVIAVASDKKQPVAAEGYEVLATYKVGHRKIVFLKLEAKTV